MYQKISDLNRGERYIFVDNVGKRPPKSYTKQFLMDLLIRDEALGMTEMAMVETNNELSTAELEALLNELINRP